MDTTAASRAVDSLVESELLDASVRDRAVEVVTRALAGPSPIAADRSGTGTRGLPKLVEVVAYLGGALVLAAGGLFLSEEWGRIGFGTRVTLLGVVAVVLGLSGVLGARGLGRDAADQRNDVRRRLSGSLLTGSALTVAFLVGYVLEETLQPTYREVYWPAVAGAAVGVLVAAVGYRLASTAVGVVGLMAGILTVVGTLADHGDWLGSSGDVYGVAFFVVGALWLAATEAGMFRELTIARALGVSVALVGAQIPAVDGTHAWLGYALTVAVAVVGIAIYLPRTAWPYLAGAVVAVTLVVPEALTDWTEGSLGATGGVLVAGITLLLASFAGYRLRAEATDGRGVPESV
ncbi:MAG: hypothetical protein ABIN79_04615 [Marmoricola sp.]